MINLSDSKFLKNMYKLSIPSIRLKQKIYVPMMAPKLIMSESNKYE